MSWIIKPGICVVGTLRIWKLRRICYRTLLDPLPFPDHVNTKTAFIISKEAPPCSKASVYTTSSKRITYKKKVGIDSISILVLMFLWLCEQRCCIKKPGICVAGTLRIWWLRRSCYRTLHDLPPFPGVCTPCHTRNSLYYKQRSAAVQQD